MINKIFSCLKDFKIGLLIFLFTTLTQYNTALACVDYHPTPPPIVVTIDSNLNRLCIRVQNLNIFGGTQGQFCSCALSSFTNIFSNIYYVAFVDSGTSNPINGFDIWQNQSAATNAWSGVLPGSDWSGFVAEVTDSLVAGLAVDLLIYANLPAGYTTNCLDSSFICLDTALTQTSFGTDEWSANGDSLTGNHQSVSTLNVPPPANYIQVALTSFPPSISAITTPGSCYGSSDGSISVSVIGGLSPYTYSWSTGSTSSSINSLMPGNYTVTVTDKNLLTVFQSILVENPDSLDMMFMTTDATCAENSDGSASVSVWGGTAAYSYLWSTGSTANEILNIMSGTYTVTITDGNNCKDTTSVAVGAPDSLDMKITLTHLSCNGSYDGAAQVSAYGGTLNYTYKWTPGITMTTSAYLSLSGLAANTYPVTVTDANNCMITDSAIITEPDSILYRLSSTNLSCNGLNDGTASASVWGGNTPYNYIWSNGDSLWNTMGLAAETYYLSIMDVNGCWEYDSVTITATSFSIGATSVNVNCNGESDGSVTIATSGGTSPYAFMWSTGDTVTWLDSLAGGSYAVTVTDDSSLCAFAWVNLTEPDTSLYSTSGASDIACNGDGDGSIMVTVMGGTNPYTYLWSDGSISQNLGNMDGGTYKLTVTDANDCMLYASIKINEPDSLLADVDQVDISCNGIIDGTAKAKITGGTKSYIYSWSTGNSLSTASGLSEGNYSLTVTDANGCEDIATFSIIEPGDMTASIAKTNVLCKGYATGEVDLTVGGGTGSYTYAWSNSKSSQDQKFLKAGTYSVVVTDGNDCNASASATLSEPSSSMTVTTNSTTPVWPNGGDASVSVTGGTSPYSYQWYSGQDTSYIDSITSGVYSVVITDANGCRIVAYVEVPTGMNAVGSSELIIIYPNPSNGVLFIDYELTSSQQQIIFSIFNQLGELVLERKIENPNTLINKIDLNLEQLPSGSYLLKMDLDKSTISKNIILTK